MFRSKASIVPCLHWAFENERKETRAKALTLGKSEQQILTPSGQRKLRLRFLIYITKRISDYIAEILPKQISFRIYTGK